MSPLKSGLLLAAAALVVIPAFMICAFFIGEWAMNRFGNSLRSEDAAAIGTFFAFLVIAAALAGLALFLH